MALKGIKFNNKIINIPQKTSELTNDSGFVTETELNNKDFVTEKSLSLIAQSGKLSDAITDSQHLTVSLTEKETWDGKITLSDIPAASNSVSGLVKLATDQEVSAGTNDTNAVTPKQLRTAIDGIGTVFDLKGSVETLGDLPTQNNEIGDVWYVKSESVGYIWLNDGTQDRWEQLGPTVNLSNYLQISDIVNNLTSTDAEKPLAASQGKIIDDKISSTNQQLSLAKKAITGLQNSVTDNTEDIATNASNITALQTTANTAQSTANTANTNAQNAQSTANTALTTANGAVSKNIEQDTSISALQTADSQNVKLTGDQSIGGVKDFIGALKIAGKDCVSVEESGEGYIRYSDGTQIIFDRQKATSNPSTFTFPKAFIDTNYRILFSNGNGKDDGTIVQNTNGITLGHYTTTSFQAEKYRGWGTDINYDFIAIGKWK